jgi:hypothetical protein
MIDFQLSRPNCPPWFVGWSHSRLTGVLSVFLSAQPIPSGWLRDTCEATNTGPRLVRWNEITVVVKLRLCLPWIMVGVAIALIEATSVGVLAIDVDFE